MIKEKEDMLEKLRNVKQTAEQYLAENDFENYVVKNVVRYNKEVELTKKDSGNKDIQKFHLYVVELENIDPEIEGKDILTELEYLEDENGNLYTISDLIKEYEGFEDIKDVVDRTKENEEKTEEEKDKELRKDSLEELEIEKEQEEHKKKEDIDDEQDKDDYDKNDLTGKKPKYLIQTIDIDKAYIDNWTTVRKGFGLPAGVEKIAIANPMQKDDNILSSNMTMYMLDNKGNIIENVNGKTIEDFFEIDDSTGNNPVYDDNTKFELEGYVERNKGQTMRRFKSKENPDLYLSVEQKKIGDYVQVYAGGKTKDGNDPVEVQLETDNTDIQTSLKMQQIISDYKGEYNKDYIDREADIHDAHGDDEEKIAIENADGDELTKVACESPYVPDTNITWEQFSKSVGDKDVKELMEEFFKQYEGNNGQELILKIQADYKEQEDLEKIEEIEIEEEYEGRVPWDSTRH